MSPILLWFLAGIGFFAIELILPGFIVFFFGLGAWCTSLTLYFFSPSLSGQLMIFMGTSLAALVLLRSWLSGIFHGEKLEQNDSTSVVPSGATGIVTESICPPSRGRVKYGGSFWQAEAEEPIEQGAVVTIIRQQDLLVYVKPALTEE